jgi:hypothetical protein
MEANIILRPRFRIIEANIINTVALLLGGVMPTEVLLRMAGDLHLLPGGDEFP